MPTLVPHAPGFPGALRIPTAHRDALDPGQDHSEAGGAWRRYQEGKVLWWIWFMSHPFKFMGRVTARARAWVHPVLCLCTLAPCFRGSPLLTPPGRESWGLLSQLRAPGFSG